MRLLIRQGFAALLLVLLWACTPGAGESPEGTATASQEGESGGAPAGAVDPAFGETWYRGLAELTSYTLEQARYGEIHPGHAVLIFVTEDLSESKQVKLDNPTAAGGDAVKVLKLNLTKKFNTGIYPYSVMTSVFTPVDRRSHPRTLKVTTTSQEWCGHTFTQLNLGPEVYRVHQFSYFEGEGDRTLDIDAVVLEDEIWTTIRLNPDDLPTGRIRILPGTLHQRLRHTSWDVMEAEATRNPLESQPGRTRYELRYPETGRTLAIVYRTEFPHEIDSWEETVRSGFGPSAPRLTTRATLRKRIWTDYWTKNGVEDVVLRRELGLGTGTE